jgi:hypothetical protein
MNSPSPHVGTRPQHSIIRALSWQLAAHGLSAATVARREHLCLQRFELFRQLRMWLQKCQACTDIARL